MTIECRVVTVTLKLFTIQYYVTTRILKVENLVAICAKSRFE